MKTKIFSILLLIFLVFQLRISAQSKYILSEEQKQTLVSYIQTTDSLVDYGEYEKALIRYQEFFNLDCNEKPDPEKTFKMKYLDNWGKELVEKYSPALLPFISLRDEFIIRYRQGNKYHWIFQYILDMNRILQQEDQSFILLEELEQDNRMLAELSWPLLKQAAIDYERYDLLEKYRYNVKSEYDQLVFLHKMLNLAALKDSFVVETHKAILKENIEQILQVGLELKDTSGVESVFREATQQFGALNFEMPGNSIPNLKSE